MWFGHMFHDPSALLAPPTPGSCSSPSTCLFLHLTSLNGSPHLARASGPPTTVLLIRCTRSGGADWKERALSAGRLAKALLVCRKSF